MVYVIQLASRIRTEPVPSWSCSQAVGKLIWHTPFLCVQWKIPNDGQRNCPKHGELYSKNKYEKLVHLLGFIIRMTDLVDAFRNFANAPEKVSSVSHMYEHPHSSGALLSPSLSLSLCLFWSKSRIINTNYASDNSCVGEHDMLKNRRVKYALGNDSRRMF